MHTQISNSDKSDKDKFHLLAVAPQTLVVWHQTHKKLKDLKLLKTQEISLFKFFGHYT